MIKIKRESGYVDRFRAYKVVLDGDVIGEIKNGQEVEFAISPGSHQLHLKIDWCRSNIVNFETAGKLVNFACGSNLRGIKLLFTFLYTTFLRSQYLWLKKV
jgi:hypothetical protein